ncbi:TPA: flavodoxin [Clostridioides difficile]|nr:flavodoxin [Clostridioides difficile]
MRKILTCILALSCVLGLTACNNSTNSEPQKEVQSQSVPSTNALVVYFSMPETTDSKNMTEEEDNSTVVIDGKVMGNTQYVAMEIQEKTSADIFRIEPETPYTTNHEELVDIASQEQEENTRPAIKDRIADFEQYDTVFVGYLIWWSDLPMIMYSFFDEYDFSDKTIIPFSTHGGSGLADTISTIKELEPNATVYEQGLSISRNDVEKSSEEISQWLEKVIRE